LNPLFRLAAAAAAVVMLLGWWVSQAARSVRLNISHSYDICHDGFASLSLSLFHPFFFS
jgi:hypothetical protein